MAIQTAGQKTAKATKVSIENQSTIALPKGTDEHIQKVLDYLPGEHIRGLEKVKLVDFINDPRFKNMDVPDKRRPARSLSSKGTGIKTRGWNCRWGRLASADRGVCQKMDGQDRALREMSPDLIFRSSASITF